MKSWEQRLPVKEKSLEVLEQRVPVFVNEPGHLVSDLTSVMLDSEIPGMLQCLVWRVQLKTEKTQGCSNTPGLCAVSVSELQGLILICISDVYQLSCLQVLFNNRINSCSKINQGCLLPLYQRNDTHICAQWNMI